jgi:hypothetical protein
MSEADPAEGDGIVEKLKKFSEMHENGLMTDEEYAVAKESALGLL